VTTPARRPSPAAGNPPGERPGFASAAAAFRHRNFSLFFAGALCSNTGTWVQNLTVPFVVFGLTGSPAWVGVAAFTQLFPLALASVVGGALADRYQRRSVLLITQSCSAAVAVGLWAMWVTGATSLPVVLALVFVGGLVAGVNIPSWQAFVTQLVPRELLLNAITLNSTQFNAARAFGPALGGVILARFGVGAAFAFNALSYAVVLVALGAITVGPVVRQGLRESVLGGMATAVRSVARHRGMSTCVLAVAALGLLASPVNALLVVFAEEVFAVDRLRYGFLGASLGVGAILAAPLVAGPGTAVRRSILAGGGMAVHGAALAAFALAPVFPVALGFLVLAGAAYLPIAATLNTTLQLQVDEGRRGKVLALYITVFTVAIPVGALAQGVVAGAVGARPTVLVASALFLVVTAALVATGRMAALDDERVSATGATGDGSGPGEDAQSPSGS
jgi:MFS family permease